MAPIIKASLGLLSLSTAAIQMVAAHGHNVGMLQGRHLKQVQRDEASKREFAPYGYDRCGVPRVSPYVRKAGASPSASANWKPCPNALTGADKEKANPSVPTQEDQEAEDEAEDSTVNTADDKSGDNNNTEDDNGSANPPAQRLAAGETGKDDSKDGDAPVTKTGSASSSSSATWAAPSSDSWSRAQFTAPNAKVAMVASSSKKNSDSDGTQYTTEWHDETTTSTWTPEAKPSPAPESSSKDNNNGGGGNTDDAPKTSASAAPVTPATVHTGSGPRIGLAWDWQNPSGKLSQWAGNENSAIYTWSAYPPSDPLPAGMVWYPQYWGPGKQGDIEGQIARGVIKPGMTILGYNEPDQAGQANLGVWDAIGSFKRQLTPLVSQGYTITSPATTSDEKGFQWIKEFMDNCQDCGISILQTHYYGTNADDFIAYIQRLRQFGLPILISEYASETFGWGADLSLAETEAYVAKTQNWLKQQSDIVAYFYFGPITPQAANGVNHNSLMISGSGDINALGRQYLGDSY